MPWIDLKVFWNFGLLKTPIEKVFGRRAINVLKAPLAILFHDAGQEIIVETDLHNGPPFLRIRLASSSEVPVAPPCHAPPPTGWNGHDPGWGWPFCDSRRAARVSGCLSAWGSHFRFSESTTGWVFRPIFSI